MYECRGYPSYKPTTNCTCEFDMMTLGRWLGLVDVLFFEIGRREGDWLGSVASGANVEVLLDIHAKGSDALRIM
jgi:hypothetical protein